MSGFVKKQTGDLVTTTFEGGGSGVNRKQIKRVLAYVDESPAPEADGSDVIFFFIFPTASYAYGAPKAIMQANLDWSYGKADEKIRDPNTPVFSRSDALIAMLSWWLIQDKFDAEIGFIMSSYMWAIHALSQGLQKDLPTERIRYGLASIQNGKFGCAFCETREEIAEAIVMQTHGHPFFGTRRKGH
jgi:hypothetical protein